jgi:hypothetical protein
MWLYPSLSISVFFISASDDWISTRWHPREAEDIAGFSVQKTLTTTKNDHILPSAASSTYYRDLQAPTL